MEKHLLLSTKKETQHEPHPTGCATRWTFGRDSFAGPVNCPACFGQEMRNTPAIEKQKCNEVLPQAKPTDVLKLVAQPVGSSLSSPKLQIDS